mmetsp:Transcript_64302/g.152150  ORF Transcript_64302/g.152150 Transcript_64302/m.152150 type:complete len:200 (+) Transcript_64302:469-1068(+)
MSPVTAVSGVSFSRKVVRRRRNSSSVLCVPALVSSSSSMRRCWRSSSGASNNTMHSGNLTFFSQLGGPSPSSPSSGSPSSSSPASSASSASASNSSLACSCVLGKPSRIHPWFRHSGTHRRFRNTLTSVSSVRRGGRVSTGSPFFGGFFFLLASSSSSPSPSSCRTTSVASASPPSRAHAITSAARINGSSYSSASSLA